MRPPGIGLVTVASAGIGPELARVFAENRHDIVLVALSAERLESIAGELRREHAREVRVLARDLPEPGAPEAIFATLAAAEIDIDVVRLGTAPISFPIAGEYGLAELFETAGAQKINQSVVVVVY